MTKPVCNTTHLRQNAQLVADFLKLIGNTNRLLILCHLAEHEACVSDLERELKVSQPALSQHLARLRQENVLETRREGQQIYYSVKDERIAKMLPALNDIFVTLK
jgi:DNA-binding transcriptional ArsR family regulator